MQLDRLTGNKHQPRYGRPPSGVHIHKLIVAPGVQPDAPEPGSGLKKHGAGQGTFELLHRRGLLRPVPHIKLDRAVFRSSRAP